MTDVVQHPMGEGAVLAEVAARRDVLALRGALAASAPEGIVDLVPAARTVLVRFDPRRVAASAVRAWIERAAGGATSDAAVPGPRVQLAVRYDGPDLVETAELLGIPVPELVARHRDARWEVAFTGFAPGFGYLVSEDWPFDVPRLSAPRTRVPPGAVGLAGAFSGAYPRETPGGWRLIATTGAALFDPDAADPVLLPPGARVRFVEAGGGRAPRAAASPGGGPLRTTRRVSPPIDAAAGDAATGAGTGDAATGAGKGDAVAGDPPRSIRVVEPGLAATVQDLGREGRAALGIARSGALDRTALRRGNRLLGNDERAAGIEVALGGFAAVAGHDTWVAVTGAYGTATIGGRPIDRNAATAWPAGDELRLDWFSAGARAYVAVRGGIDVPPVAGSRATDVLAGLGPAPLAAATVLPVGADPGRPIPVADLAPWGAPQDEVVEVELAAGPRADWFDGAALRELFAAEWTVTNDADRVGMRLEGPRLARARSGELASEGMVPGALQVPPSGRPTILLADGPVTGGYPVIAVATDAALDALGQARPGTRLRFRHARPSV